MASGDYFKRAAKGFRIWPQGWHIDEHDPLEPWEEMGWEMKCYLEEKGVLEGKLHAHGEGHNIVIALPNLSERMINDVVKRGIYVIAHRYDYYIDVVPKKKIHGYVIHVCPKHGWMTCLIT